MTKINLFRPKMTWNDMFWPKNYLKSRFSTQKWAQMTLIYPWIRHFRKTPFPSCLISLIFTAHPHFSSQFFYFISMPDKNIGLTILIKKRHPFITSLELIPTWTNLKKLPTTMFTPMVSTNKSETTVFWMSPAGLSPFFVYSLKFFAFDLFYLLAIFYSSTFFAFFSLFFSFFFFAFFLLPSLPLKSYFSKLF